MMMPVSNGIGVIHKKLKKGRIRSLVGIVEDIAGAILANDSIEKLKEFDFESLPVVDSPVRINLLDFFTWQCGLDRL